MRSVAKIINVTSYENVITLMRLDHPRGVSQFINEIQKVIKNGYKNIKIILKSTTTKIFPNAAVPIAGVIDYYRRFNGVNFSIEGRDVCNILTPTNYDFSIPNRILGKVITFDKNDANRLSSVFISDLRKSDEFPVGLLNALEWSINEVMDNVIQHSNSEYGFVMGQIHPKTKYIAFTIYDYGQGIFNSFRQTNIHNPRSAVDAITLAIKEEVTSDHTKGQGNGLFGLHSIISHGKGALTITSDVGSFMYNGETNYTKTFDKIPILSKCNAATIVDFKLNYSNDVSLGDALAFRGKKYNFVNIDIEKLEDERGNLIYSISNTSEGTGTREAAKRTFNEIINLINESKKNVILDFSQVTIISSSYADQLIAQLLLRFGLFRFNRLIRLSGMNETQEQILQRSVIQRLVREYTEGEQDESKE